MATLRMNLSAAREDRAAPVDESEAAFAKRLQALVARSKADPRPSIGHAEAMRQVEVRLAALRASRNTALGS